MLKYLSYAVVGFALFVFFLGKREPVCLLFFSIGVYFTYRAFARRHQNQPPKVAVSVEYGVLGRYDVDGLGKDTSLGLCMQLLGWTVFLGIREDEFVEVRKNHALYLSGQPFKLGTLAAGGMALNIRICAAGLANTAYRFTSSIAAAQIAESGVIAPGSGIHGSGVYVTALNSPIWGAISGAASTEAAVVVEGADLLATPWPGAFRIAGAVGIW
jgi:hypothetical protein